MPAEPGATRRRTEGGGPRPAARRLTLNRREALAGCGATALTALLAGRNEVVETAAGTAPRRRDEPWDDGTYWDDGTGWV